MSAGTCDAQLPLLDAQGRFEPSHMMVDSAVLRTMQNAIRDVAAFRERGIS